MGIINKREMKMVVQKLSRNLIFLGGVLGLKIPDRGVLCRL